MRCIKCGAELMKGHKFCVKCGTKVEQNNVSKQSKNGIKNESRSTVTPSFFEDCFYVPVFVETILFEVKQGYTLNSLQTLLANAIKDEYTVDQIAEASKMKKEAIESELSQMETQKLLLKKSTSYKLSELTEHLIFLSSLTEKINNKKIKFCINVLDEKLYIYDSKIIKNILSEKDFLLIQNGENFDSYSKQERKLLSNIAVENNRDTIINGIDEFKNINEYDLSKFLDETYITFNYSNQLKYMKFYFSNSAGKE